MNGQYAIKGYLLQSLVALLDSFETDWETVCVEPNDESEKVDILWTYNGSVLKPSCKPILLSTQFHKYLLPLHHEESPIITLHLSRCTCRLL